MKRILTTILLCLALSAAAFGANELRLDYATGATIVAAVTNDAGQWWDTAGAAFESYNTLTDYDIAATDAGGGVYLATMPSLAAGRYTIKWYSGTTHIASTENVYWSGTAVYNPAAHAKTAAEAAQTQIGTAVALDGGTASIAGMLTKLADDNGGADYDATTHSLAKIGPATEAEVFGHTFTALGMTFEDIVETWLFSHDGSHDGGN